MNKEVNEEREQEIISSAYEYINEMPEIFITTFGDFINGAKWADLHPQKGLVDINEVCAWLRRTQPKLILPDTTIERLRAEFT